jgi:phosphonate transport system ATP-binding protein
VAYPGSAEPALRGINLELQAGDFAAVVGSSGAGKSTLLRAICGLIAPVRGVVEVGGQAVHERDGAAARRRVSMIFQSFNLTPRLSVLTNVLIGRLAQKRGIRKALGIFDDDDRAIALDSLARVGMIEHALKDVRLLSGGQKQRVAIARCLAQRASVILADEPVASLDPVNATRVIKVLNELSAAHGITVLVNLHQMDLVDRYFDRVIGLDRGQLAFVRSISRSPAVPAAFEEEAS